MQCINPMSLLLTLSLLLLQSCPVAAQDAEKAVLQERVESLERRLAEMESLVRTLQRSDFAPSAAAATPAEEVAAAPESLESPNAPQPLQAYFNQGLQLRSSDGAFDIRVGGRTQFDMAFFDADERWERLAALNPDFGLGDEDDGVAFRRARLSIRGTIYEHIGFKAQYDFAVNSPGNDGAQFRDVFIEFKDVPWVDKVRIGHFQEPFSLEEMTSNSYMTFMERSLANVFTPSFNTGLTVEKSVFQNRIHGVVGIFKTTDFWPSDNDSNEAAGYGITARLTGVPWASEDGRSLIHLGLNASRRNPDGAITFRQRPESYLAQRYVDTGALDTGRLFTYGIEGAVVHGALSLQGEFIAAELDTSPFGKRSFSGYYGAISWLLTGEQRPYKKGAFWRVIPAHPFAYRGDRRGWGAWEVAARYSQVDLNDGPIQGGTEENVTLGVNWYLNANTRIMVNYIYAQIDNSRYDGDLEILQSRVQVDF